MFKIKSADDIGVAVAHPNSYPQYFPAVRIEELFPREQMGPHCTSLHTQRLVEHLAREPALVFCAKLYIQEVYLGHPFLVSRQFRSRQTQRYGQCTDLKILKSSIQRPKTPRILIKIPTHEV